MEREIGESKEKARQDRGREAEIMRQKFYTRWDEVPVIIDIAMACRILGVSPPTAKRLIYSGQLPANKVGSCWRISKESLRDYIENKEAS